MRKPIVLICAALLAACASVPEDAPPLPRADSVELERFMGDWYVIAHVPPFVEDEAYNGVERYKLCSDGRVATSYRYRDGGFDAELEVARPTGYPLAETGNVEWGMMFFWPIKAEYIVAWLDADYQTTIIARSKRDYAWLMHREPEMTEGELQAGLQRLEAMGYASDAIRRVPQQWPELDGTEAPQPISAPSCD